MPLTAPPDAPDSPPATPQRGGSGFSAAMNAFLLWMVTFRSWLATWVAWVETHVTELDALQSTVTAQAASAASGNNYKGAWSTLSGALAIPASASHSGKLWLLTASVADVTAHTPGVSANWLDMTVNVTPTSHTSTAISADLALTSASTKAQSVASSVLGRAVILPDATTLKVGDQYIIRNTGALPVGLRSNGNTLIGVCGGAGTITAVLLSNGSAAGTWDVGGDGYLAGMVTLDNTFSETYTTGYHYGADLGGGLSVHVIGLAANGFAAYVIDSTGRTVGTPLSISTVSGVTPRGIYTVSSTTAVIFWADGADTKCAVVTATGTSLAVGSTATLSGASLMSAQTVSGIQKIVALSATLYLIADITSSTQYAAAMSISGTTCTWGTRSDTAITNSINNSGQLYRLTSTTALFCYIIGAGAPYTNNVRVLSVSGTTVTSNTAAIVTGVDNASAVTVCNICVLSSTLAMVVDTGNSTTTIKAASVTISGNTVTANTAITVEGSLASVGFAQAHSLSGAAKNPPLRALTTTTAVVVYSTYDGTYYESRAVVLSDSAGTLTAGTILKGSVFNRVAANTQGEGLVIPGDATSLPFAMAASAPTNGGGAGRLISYMNHSISGTTITPGQAAISRLPLAEFPSPILGVRLSSGDCILVSQSNIAPPQAEVLRFANGGVGHRGRIDLPRLSDAGSRSIVDYWGSIAYSNGTLLVGQFTEQSGSTAATRIARLEVAA